MTQLNFKESNNNSGFVGDGIFVDLAVVKSIKDISGKTTDFQREAQDLALEVTFLIEKNGWERTLTFGGNFKRDDNTSETVGWGGAFLVREFLQRLEAVNDDTELDKDNHIAIAVIEDAVSRYCLLLSYPNNKGKSSTWNRVGHQDTDRKEFKDFFMSEYQKSGYPKNFALRNSEVIPIDGVKLTDNTPW